MEPFDPPLAPDPGIALRPPIVEPLAVGPAYRAQFVLELVGQHSVPASAAAQLLTPAWFAALGQPELFCMTPADTSWQVLTGRTDGSYDSLVLCWDILTAQGQLTTQSARHLFQQTEKFANALGRRAMPLPVPDDVNRTVRDLLKIQEQLDIGVSLVVMSKRAAVSERDLWIVCSKLDLTFSPAGSFDWRVPHHPSPLLSVTPIGDVDYFNLRQVQNNLYHEGVTVGFNVPRCPSPLTALDGAFKVCEAISGYIGGIALDDNSALLTPSLADEMRKTLQLGVDALERVGVRPGSAAAIKLF